MCAYALIPSHKTIQTPRISHGRLKVSILQKHPGHCLAASQVSIAPTRLSLEFHEYCSSASQVSIAPVELSAYSQSQYFDISFHFFIFLFLSFDIPFHFRQFLWLLSNEAYYGFGDSSGAEARFRIFTNHNFSQGI